MQRRVLIKANKRIKFLCPIMPTLASLRLAYRKIKQHFTIPTIVSAYLTYGEL
jgi:hypothetical protein